jgi:predicted transposase YdaD
VGEDLGFNIKWETKGEARGEERKALEIAKNFLAKGYPVEDIADATGLKPREVRKLVQK